MTRHLHFPDILNARDLGGLPTKNGGSTRHGVFVRTANLSELDNNGAQAIYDHGIRTIIDLRCAEELRMTPSRFPELHTLTVLHLPFLGESMQQLQARKVDDSDGKGYRDMLNKFQPEVAQIMRGIADAPEGGVLFHCFAGKDRTGLTSMLLLSLVGVPDEIIAEDYSLSEAALEPMRLKHLASTTDPKRQATINADYNCSPTHMHTALNHLHTRYGGAPGYLRTIGLDEQAIGRLRQRIE